MTDALPLRSRAEAATANLAALLARAEQLAAAVMPGGHGRRRAGAGDDFWQYRPVQAGDTLRMVDWRRSAQSDAQFVRQKEWKISQSIFFWVDRARSMQFASGPHLPQKIDRAQLVSLAAGILLSRGGSELACLVKICRRVRAQNSFNALPSFWRVRRQKTMPRHKFRP